MKRRGNGPSETALVPAGADEWVELFPHAITVGSPSSRPILVLRDAKEDLALPVWLSPLDAGLALADLSMLATGSLHSASRKILDSLKVEIDRCVFMEMVGHHQYVHLFFKGHPSLEYLRFRADDVMSFCLSLKARFWAKRGFIAQCRQMDAELLGVEMGLQLKPEIGSKNHPYMM